MVWLMVFVAETKKKTETRPGWTSLSNYAISKTNLVATLIKMNCMKCVMFILKFIVLLKP